jgi:hypothetical protein
MYLNSSRGGSANILLIFSPEYPYLFQMKYSGLITGSSHMRDKIDSQFQPQIKSFRLPPSCIWMYPMLVIFPAATTNLGPKAFIL